MMMLNNGYLEWFTNLKVPRPDHLTAGLAVDYSPLTRDR